MATVDVYTTGYCPYCTAAKSLLKQKGVTFNEVKVDGDAAKREWLVKTTGQRTVPQIFINNRSIGGFQELSELESTGKLDELLK
ncbi:glutaredoxin 3 [bacterium]|nr:glutaredoxin 3 [bacterium]